MKKCGPVPPAPVDGPCQRNEKRRSAIVAKSKLRSYIIYDNRKKEIPIAHLEGFQDNTKDERLKQKIEELKRKLAEIRVAR